MEDLLGIILEVILEILGELLLEFLAAAAADAVSRTLRRFLIAFHRIGPILSCVVFGLAGCLAGFFSLAVFPHPLFGARHYHGISLLISPVGTGLGMSLLGRMVQKRGSRRARIETFRYGFVFALAMAIVRLLLISRP